jgi:hypothetical protein
LNGGMKISVRLAAALVLWPALLAACANPEAQQASRQAAQAEADAKDDAACREKGLTPGTEPYDACRNTLAQATADEAARQEQRRIEFQKTLGAGTESYTGR